jgi:glucose-6-phosphate dehydrogenase assembly protein OpcA
MPALADAVWSEEGTTPDAVEAALRELLRERYAEDGAVAPARALNMIAIVDQQWSGEIANRLRGVGRYHASRLILLSYDPRRERLDARVSVATESPSGPGAFALLRETVLVQIGARHLDDLLTITDPMVVTDLPTLLWSPHGHHQMIDALLALAQAVLVDSIDEPVWREAIDRAQELTGHAYVVDLAWLRSTPWRERIASSFDPGYLRSELQTITEVTVRHHPNSTVAAMLLVGWLASRLQWQVSPLVSRGETLLGKVHGRRQDVELRLQRIEGQTVRGLAGVTLRTATGRQLILDRGPGGLHAIRHERDGSKRQWRILGASRGEGGILGEGIRQALLRDPTYAPALLAAKEMLP